MSKLIPLFQFLLALCGVSLGGTSFSDRVSVDGNDTLYSRAQVEAGVAHFACMASASGRCHYTLFADRALDECNTTPTQAGTTRHCPPAPLKRFAVSAGDSQDIAGLPTFHLCVSIDGLPLDIDCKMPTTRPDPRVAATPSG